MIRLRAPELETSGLAPAFILKVPPTLFFFRSLSPLCALRGAPTPSLRRVRRAEQRRPAVEGGCRPECVWSSRDQQAELFPGQRVFLPARR